MKTNDSRKIPDFFIVGAAKSGTTSLFHYLRQHPQVFMPSVKEPIFFVSGLKIPPIIKPHRKTKTFDNLEEYLDLFSSAREEQVLGEASTIYFQCPERVLQNMERYSVNRNKTKIIIILRNPVERVYSGYMMMKQAGVEKREFSKAIRYESMYRNFGYEWDPLDYIDLMMTAKRLRIFLDNFPKCKVCFLEDLISSPQNFMKDIFSFLEIENNFEVQVSNKFNVTGEPRIRAIDKLLRKPDPLGNMLPGIAHLMSDDRKNQIIEKLIGINIKSKHKMSASDRKYLSKMFKEDIKEVGTLLDRKLSHWVESPTQNVIV